MDEHFIMRPMIILLLLLHQIQDADLNCGTPASMLEEKCLAYPSLTEYYNGKCYIVELKNKKTSAEAKNDRSICNHLDGYRANLAEIDVQTSDHLKSIGVINKRQPVFARNYHSEDIEPNEKYAYICQYADEFSCKSGYELSGLHCYKIYNNKETWKNAAKDCSKRSESLAVVHDDDTAQFIGRLSWSNESATWTNVDATSPDFFRWFGKKDGYVTESASPYIASYAFLHTRINNAAGEGVFGYMDIDKEIERKSYACQHIALHSFGQVVVPDSNLWLPKN